MKDLIVIAILAVVITAVIVYIVRQKKKGKKCIGCPYSGSGSCSCGKKEV